MGDRMDPAICRARRRITRRRALETLLLMAAGTTLLGACGPTPAPSSSSATPAPAAPTATTVNQPAPTAPAASVATPLPAATSVPVTQAAPANAPKPGGILRVGNV